MDASVIERKMASQNKGIKSMHQMALKLAAERKKTGSNNYNNM
jgi:hypothetical protein